MKQSHKTLLLWVLLILMFVAIYNLVAEGEQPRSVAFSDFITDVQASRVDKVEIRPHDNSAEITFWVQPQNESGPREKKVTIGVVGEELNKTLLEHDVNVQFLPEDQVLELCAITSGLPDPFLLSLRELLTSIRSRRR